VDHDFRQVRLLQPDDVHDGRLLGKVELHGVLREPLGQPCLGELGEVGEIRGRLLPALHPLVRPLADSAVAVALAQLLAGFGGEDHGQVRVHRARVTERLLEGDVVARVEQVLLPAEHVRDAHLVVVHDDSEVVRGHAVTFADDEVLHLAGADALPGSQHRVVELVRLHRHGEPHDVRPAFRLVLADLRVGELPPGVAELPLLPLGLLPQRVELFLCVVRLVRLPAGDHAVDDLVVEVHALRLVDQLGVVPVQAEPAEVFQQLARRLLGAPGEVGVFDAEEVAPAVVAGQEPVEQGRAGAADVQVAGGGGREAGDHLRRRRAGRVGRCWSHG
jgi:hypothetical protein